MIRRRLGGRLRELREASGLRLEEVARALECSVSKVSRLETGQGIPKVRDVRDLMELYDVDEEDRERLTRWTAEAKAQGWWHSYSDAVPNNLDFFISLEAESSSVRVYTPFSIYGLFQTYDYARALLDDIVVGAPAMQLDRIARLRLERQEVVRREHHPLKVRAVIDEGSLLRVIGSPSIMAEQLAALQDLSQQPHIDILVFGFEAGSHEAVNTFCIFTPRDARDHTIVNMENTGHDSYIEEESEVLSLVNIFDDLASRCLDADDSRERIARHARRHQQVAAEAGSQDS